MSRYESTQTAYSPQKKKNIPIWRLDVNNLTVTRFDPDTLTEEHKTYRTDCIRDHLHYSDSKCPDRLRRLVNEGKIIEYLDNLERKISKAISHKIAYWKKTDNYYQTALLAGDKEDIIGLENNFENVAKEIVFNNMVYT